MDSQFTPNSYNFNMPKDNLSLHERRPGSQGKGETKKGGKELRGEEETRAEIKENHPGKKGFSLE